MVDRWKSSTSKSREIFNAPSGALPRPVVDPSDRLAHLVKDAGKALARALQARLAERSVAYGHWTFLRVLWKHDGISQAELSRLAGVMTSSTFTAVQGMEKLGYVVRRQKPENRKKIYIYLTAAGRALESELVPLAIDVNDTSIAGLSERQISEFRKVLVSIIKTLDEEKDVMRNE